VCVCRKPHTPTPYTLRPTPYALHFIPHTLCHTPSTPDSARRVCTGVRKLSAESRRVRNRPLPLSLPFSPSLPLSLSISRQIEAGDSARLVFKDHRWLYHSTLGSRVIKQKKTIRRGGYVLACGSCPPQHLHQTPTPPQHLPPHQTLTPPQHLPRQHLHHPDTSSPTLSTPTPTPNP